MNYGFRNSLPPMSADVIMSRWFQSTPQKSSHETNDQLQRQYYLRFLEIFLLSNRRNASQLVLLHFNSKPVTVLCHVGDFGCGDGAWTPVMKIDGNKVRYSLISGCTKLKDVFKT